MSNLKLITTETFNNMSCNFYRNMNDDILLTREQIGQALEYANPIKAIQKIHDKHKDRLDELSIRIKSETLDVPQNGVGRNLMTERVYYTERGIMEICRWSRQSKANEFMDWVWDIIEKYRHNELIPDLAQVTSALAAITNTFTVLTQAVTTMQQDISDLKKANQPKLPKKKYSYWSTKMFPKYQLLTDYFNISNKELYKQLYNEMKNTYPDIDLNQEVDDYCYEHNLESCYTLDVIEHNLALRKMFELLVDNILEKYNLQDKYNNNTIIPTIFNFNEAS